MTADGYLLFLTRYANLKKAHMLAQDKGIKQVWQNKIDELVTKEEKTDEK